MGKSANQKLGILRTASKMRAEYRKWLYLLIGGLVICVGAVFIYMYAVGAMIIPNEFQFAWIAAAFAAAILGWFGNKFSRTNREYQSFLYMHKITNEDVKEFLRNYGKGE